MARVAVIKFTAAWCGPCQNCAPAYAALLTEFEAVDFHEVDADKDEGTMGAYKVQSLPTFVLLVDGIEVQRVVGAKVSFVRTEVMRLLGENPVVPPTSSPSDGGTPCEALVGADAPSV